MANRLLERLRAKDKKGLFTRTQTSVSYNTGFTTFDYRNGFMLQVRDLDDTLVDEYPSLGLVGGTFVTIVGKPGTAKTTFAVQVASKIVKPFDNGFIQHYDLEQATTYTRVKNITSWSQSDLNDKYVLKQEKSFIEDIFESIMSIGAMKEAGKDEFMYDTGLKNEFNEPIRAYQPTVVIVDAIPSMASIDTDGGDMEGSTYANRVARALSQFYNRLMPVIKTYNIIVISINHIKQKIDIGPVKTAAMLNYMKQDETIPGGTAPIYYANTLIKFVSAGKFSEEDEGFDGFKIRAELLKSRTNKAGQFTHLVYDQTHGFDPIRSQYIFAEESGIIEGRNPYRFITGFKDVKFDARKFRKEFLDNEQLRYALFDSTLPILGQQLSRVDHEENVKALTEVEVLQRLGVGIIGDASAA